MYLYSSDEAPLANHDDSSDEDDDEFSVSDIVRYYWNRGEIRYLISRGGQDTLRTFDALQEKYTGAKSAVWEFWKAKRRGRVNKRRLREHIRFRCHASSATSACGTSYLKRKSECFWRLGGRA